MRRILFFAVVLAILAGFLFLVFPAEKMGDDREELSLEQAVGQVLLMGFEGFKLPTAKENDRLIILCLSSILENEAATFILKIPRSFA